MSATNVPPPVIGSLVRINLNSSYKDVTQRVMLWNKCCSPVVDYYEDDYITGDLEHGEVALVVSASSKNEEITNDIFILCPDGETGWALVTDVEVVT